MAYNKKGIAILHMSLCIGILLIILLLHFFIAPIELSGFNQKYTKTVMTALIIASFSLLISGILFSSTFKKLGPELTSENINEYVKAYIIKWSLLSIATLVNILTYFFFVSHPIHIVVALLLLLLLYSSKIKFH